MTGTPQGKAHSAQRICSCFSLFSSNQSHSVSSSLSHFVKCQTNYWYPLWVSAFFFWFLQQPSPPITWGYFRENLTSNPLNKSPETRNRNLQVTLSPSTLWALFWNVHIVLMFISIALPKICLTFWLQHDGVWTIARSRMQGFWMQSFWQCCKTIIFIEHVM